MLLSPGPFGGTLALAPSSNLTFMPPSTTTLTVTASTDPSTFINLPLTSPSGYSMVSVLAPNPSTPSTAAITTASYSGIISEAEEDPSYRGPPKFLDNISAQTQVIPIEKSAPHTLSSILAHTTDNVPPKGQALAATTTNPPAQNLQQRSLPGEFGAPPANPAPTLNSPIQNVIIMVKNTAAATSVWLSEATWRFFEETGNRRGLAETELRMGTCA